MREYEKLQKDIKRQQEHIRDLQASVGRWRRMAQENAPKPQYIRESIDANSRHIKEFALKDIPGDTPYREMLDHVKYKVMPTHFPYHFHSAYYSAKYDGWVIKLYQQLEIRMDYVPEVAGEDTAKEMLDQIHFDILVSLGSWIKWINHFQSLVKEDIKEKARKNSMLLSKALTFIENNRMK